MCCILTHTHHTRPGFVLAGATSCTDCNTAAGNYCPPGSTSSAGVPCPAGTYSSAGAVGLCVPPFSPALLSLCLTCTHTRMHVPRAPVASCCTHARMHDAARAARVAAGARRAGPSMHAHMCTDVRVTAGCAHGYLGCLHAWHVCVSPAPSVCHVCMRKEQGHTHTRAHLRTHALHLTGRGGDHSFTEWCV